MVKNVYSKSRAFTFLYSVDLMSHSFLPVKSKHISRGKRALFNQQSTVSMQQTTPSQYNKFVKSTHTTTHVYEIRTLSFCISNLLI